MRWKEWNIKAVMERERMRIELQYRRNGGRMLRSALVLTAACVYYPVH